MSRIDESAAPAAAAAGHPHGGSLAGLLARFGIAGAITTAVGFAFIALLDVGFRVDPHIANAAGYALGIVVRFFLNRGYVFRSQAPGSALRFLVTMGVAFAANQLVLTLAGHILGPEPLARTAAQLAGMVTFTGTQFVLSYLWVFRRA
jgi:putative flippase GtrA